MPLSFALLASAASLSSGAFQDASLSLLVTTEELDLDAYTEIVRAGRQPGDAAAKHDFYLIPDTKVTFAVHESVVKRKAHQDRLWLLKRLESHINEYGAFSLAKMTEQERKVAAECLSASFSPDVVDRLTQNEGWVFLSPSSGMIRLTNGGKSVSLPLKTINLPEEVLAKHSNTDVLSFPEGTVLRPMDNKMNTVTDELRFKFIFPVSTLARKKEIITHAIEVITAELEAQDAEIRQAYQNLMAKATKQYAGEVQGLSKGGLVSDLPEETRKHIENTLRSSYQIMGFSSEDEVMQFLQSAKLAPLALDSYFTIVERETQDDGSVFLRSSKMPAWLHRSG